LIGCWCKISFVEKIDRACSGKSRSDFCREALREKLERHGIVVSQEETLPPDRRRKIKPVENLASYPAHRTEVFSLNDSPQKTDLKNSPNPPKKPRK
jgi:Arc/MetJ-type ribon-helix-helix transcriptional regulator